MWWLLFGAGALALGYYWLLVRPYGYWVSKGVKQGKPRLIFGDNWGPFLGKQSSAEMVEMIYNMCPNTRYSGFYQFLTPTLVLKDPDLIKQITVKDFDHFVNHRSLISEDVDPIWSNNLFFLTNQKWRHMRTNLSPVFTSSKMKYMFSLISQNGKQFVKYFLEKNENLITIEMKDTFTRFANDVIANSAFGVECDSLGDKNNEFYVMGKNLTDFRGFWRILSVFCFMLMPKLFKITIFSKEVGEFFTRMIKSNIESRDKHGIVRPDLIHILLEARKTGFKHEESHSSQDTGFATAEESEIGTSSKNKLEITDQIITAQAVGFFFAAFDSVSSLMCFMSYELGVNPDIQERLIQEVDEAFDVCNGELTYEVLLGMTYLDMVVSETLRKWPNPPFIDRVCTKTYTIESKYPDERPVCLEKDTLVWLPIFGLHRDLRYYPEPDRFDPERFNEENKAKIKPCTYLPFGFGPRNCLGSRFALLETKTLFFYLLSHFEIVPVEKTQIPLRISKTQSSLTAEGGFWFGLKRRVKSS